jgi:ABC-2 type transport system ATP-binding protein
MIKAENVTKRFENFTALDNLSCIIPKGCIYGLVGSNGAGKSTFLRLIAGIYKPEDGNITIEDATVYENELAKNKIIFIPDELYFLPQSNLKRMAKLYSSMYENFSYERFHNLCETFKLSKKNNFNTFSKGMKRQAAIILGLSAMPEYIFLDETFDGLDPVVRNLVKTILYSDVLERNSTAIITSHSLRELEDTCDQLALLHKGGIVFESDVQNLKTNLFKIQLAFNDEYDKSKFNELDILSFNKKGKVSNFIVRGDREATYTKLNDMKPILLEILPLSLEEVFIYEMEALGYAFNEILM